MSDPRFPDRPNHPDFYLISQALIDTDARADAGEDLGSIVSDVVDPASLLYAADQRALRMAPFASQAESAKMKSIWIDAFNAGAVYRDLKARDAQSFDEGDLG